MRAVCIREPGGPEVLELRDVEPPTPDRGEVAVDVRCTALNRADLLQRRGHYPAPAGIRGDIPGLEYAGVVAAVGPGVDDDAVGRRVMGLVPGAAYAERVVIAHDQTLPIPDGLGFEQAAAIPEAFCTAWDALRQADFAAGERVLVHAAGSGVGTAALQLARAMGAGRIFGTASRPKLDGIAEHGLPLDVGIDYRRESFREVVERETGGDGIDVILELVGAAYWADDLASLAHRGRLVLIGLMSGTEARTDLATVLRRRLRIVGTVMRTRPPAEKARLAAAAREQLLPWFADGTLVPVVQRVFPLSEAARAHAFMEDNRNLGKIVLRVA